MAGNLGCLFAKNDGELSDGHSVAPVGRIRGAHLNAANNRLIGVGERTALELFAEPFAVLGNLTTGPITANGQPLQPPWTALKHHGLIRRVTMRVTALAGEATVGALAGRLYANLTPHSRSWPRPPS